MAALAGVDVATQSDAAAQVGAGAAAQLHVDVPTQVGADAAAQVGATLLDAQACMEVL